MKCYDVVVVGAGASGMMAAGRAAETGASVLLLEKMDRPGNKLLISGKNRCNVTNLRDLDGFVLKYGQNGRFLYPAFKAFFRDELTGFLKRYGVETKAEKDGRVFPVSDQARDVLNALEAYLKAGAVQLQTRSAVSSISVDSGLVCGLTVGGDALQAKALVLATGGCSYPSTGSSGDGHRMVAAVGHRVTPLRPALVPLVVEEEELAKSLQGVSLRGVRLTSYRCASESVTSSMAPASEYGRGIAGKRAPYPVIESRRGDLMFTHFGLGGPVVLLASLAIVDALHEGQVSVSIDLAPEQSTNQLGTRLQLALDAAGRKEIQNVVKGFVPSRLAGALPALAGVPGAKPANQVSSDERRRVVDSMKSLRFNVRSSRPLVEAMVTAGGVSIDEIEPRTMSSRIVRGLYFCGEVIDIDAETGGYNLQAAFSTGYLAGQSAAAFADEQA